MPKRKRKAKRDIVETLPDFLDRLKAKIEKSVLSDSRKIQKLYDASAQEDDVL